MGNITIEELNAITDRSVARAKAGYDSNLTPNERKKRLNDLIASGQISAYEISLLGASIKDIAPNYAALKKAINIKKAELGAVTGQEIDTTGTGRILRKKVMYEGGQTETTKFYYNRLPTSKLIIDRRLNSLRQQPTNTPTIIPTTKKIIELAGEESKKYMPFDRIPTTDETNIRVLYPQYTFKPKSEVRAVNIDKKSFDFKTDVLKFKESRGQISTAKATALTFGLGFVSVANEIKEHPIKTIATTIPTIGAFAINPIVGGAFIAATSGKEIITGLKTKPAYTAGQLTFEVGAFKLGESLIKLPTTMRANRLSFENFESEPLQMGQQILSIEPDYFSQSLGRTVHELPKFYDTKAGQLKLKPSETVSNDLVEMTKVAFKETPKPKSPIDPEQIMLMPKMPRNKLKIIERPSGKTEMILSSEPLNIKPRIKPFIDKSIQQKLPFESHFYDEFDILRPTERGHLVQTDTIKKGIKYIKPDVRDLSLERTRGSVYGELSTFKPTESGKYVKTDISTIRARISLPQSEKYSFEFVKSDSEIITKITKRESIDFGFNKMFMVEPLSASIYGVGKLIEVGKTAIQRGGLFERDKPFTFEEFKISSNNIKSFGVISTPRIGLLPITNMDEDSITGSRFKSVIGVAIKPSLDLGTALNSGLRFKQITATTPDIKTETKTRQRQRQKIGLFQITTTTLPENTFFPKPTTGRGGGDIIEDIPETKIPGLIVSSSTRRKKQKEKKRRSNRGLLNIGFKYAPSIEAELFNVRGIKAPKILSLQLRPILR